MQSGRLAPPVDCVRQAPSVEREDPRHHLITCTSEQEVTMSETQQHSIEVDGTKHRCPCAETIGIRNQTNGRIPVLSCEGVCIHGEISRLAANIVAEEEPYARAGHGALYSMPESPMAQWIKTADQVVLIEGCFLRCHGRIIQNLVDEDKLVQFDAVSVYKKYTDVTDMDKVPEEERKGAAQNVADHVLGVLGQA